MTRPRTRWMDRLKPHTHEGDSLTVNCPACAARVADDQRRALIADSPLRRCTWTCQYLLPGDDEEDHPGRYLTFDLVVRVPAGWDQWQVEDEYANLTGDAFILALPDTVRIEWTDYACESMDVTKVAIGPVVHEVKPEPPSPPSLFEALP